MKKLTIKVTRDSVCYGDDILAPHLKRLRFESDGTIADVILHLQKQCVPLKIQGGKSTWLVEADQALAVIAQQWEHPVFLIDPNTRISDGIDLKSQTPLYAHYFGSVNPVSLLQYLILGKPFPRGLDLYQTEKLKKMCPLKCTSQL